MTNDTVAIMGDYDGQEIDATGSSIDAGGFDVEFKATSTHNLHKDYRSTLTSEAIAAAKSNKVGIAGSAAVTNAINKTESAVGNSGEITSADNVTIKAQDMSKISSKAWATTSVSGDDAKVGVGAAFAVLHSLNRISAYSDNSSSIDANGDIDISANSLRVDPASMPIWCGRILIFLNPPSRSYQAKSQTSTP